MDVVFDPDYKWNTLRGGIVGWMKVLGREVRWFVSREFVADKWGRGGAKEEVIKTFASQRPEIETLLAERLSRGLDAPVAGETFTEVALLSHAS